MMQKIFQKLRPLGILPAFAWLIVQMLMTGVFLPSNADAEVTGFEPSTIICTPNGLQVLSLVEIPTEPAETSEHICDWCQTFGNTAPLSLSEATSKVAFNAKRYRYQLTGAPTAQNKYSGNIKAIRAPPL